MSVYNSSSTDILVVVGCGRAYNQPTYSFGGKGGMGWKGNGMEGG